MPPQQGEVSLLTLFADIHYYISPPGNKPSHHRFDKGSYVYLYHSPIQQRGRIEIANYAGTPDQDAFAGHLDNVVIKQSYKHPCLFTITVDGFRGQGGSATASPQQHDPSEWHLPTPDPRNEGKYLYRLHTIDLYFWTVDDSTMFLDSLKRVVQPHQLQITPNPAAPSHLEHKNDVLNPVVAKLEKAAISHSSRSASISSTTQPFPGPPTAPAPTSSPPTNNNYAPMAYNPAAPAAPEPIAHREKTPPPPDAADGTGLGTAAIHDHHAHPSYTNPLQASFAPQPTSSQPYLPGPPSRTQTFSGPPPSAPGIHRQSTSGSIPPPPQSPPSFAPPPSVTPQYEAHGTPQSNPQRQSAVPTQQYANYPGSPGHAPAGFNNTSPLPSPGYAPQQYQPLASPPPGGYSQFQYSSTSQSQNNMHQQLYRPTKQETEIVDHDSANPAQPNSNIGKRAQKVEKGIGSFLKKLDKKF